MKTLFSLPCLTLACVALALTGCSILKPKADLTEFYVLRKVSADSVQPVAAAKSDKTLQIGPWRLPDYLNSTPIVVEDGTHGVKFLDLDQWAEPLAQGVGRVMAENLIQLIGMKRVLIYPDGVRTEPGYRIEYSVFKFEGDLDKNVVLEVFWQVLEQPSGNVLSELRSRYVVPAQSAQPNAAEYVARMSAALGQWSEDVAKAIAAAK